MNKRRKFLGFLTTGVLLPFLPVRAAAPPPSSGREEMPLVRMLDALLPDNRAMRRIGRAALRQSGGADAADILAARLFGSLDRSVAPTADQLRRHLRSLRDADFAAGDTVTVDGWILARSEAQWIGLVALHRKA